MEVKALESISAEPGVDAISAPGTWPYAVSCAIVSEAKDLLGQASV